MAKKKKTAKKRVGRPKKIFTESQIEQIDILSREGHKTYTIAVALGLDEKTLRDHFSERMAKKRVEGKIALKKAQIEKAIEAKDSTMLIWLGKNELEQKDKQDLNIGGQEGNPIPVFIINRPSKAK